MTEQGQQVLDRRAALARLEHGELPECAVCSCPWRRHLGRSGVGQCQCGCPRYRDVPLEPELEPELSGAERRQRGRERAHDGYMDSIRENRRDD
jgi:hypothetical protein